MVYHYPFYSTVPFIVSHYKDAFPHIAVCGPKASAEYQILAVDMGPRGYYSYECLGAAIRLHPGYRGYMFVNDDMIVNWWNFAKLSKEKIWQGSKIDQRVAHEMNRRPIRDDWMWWRKESGLKNCEKAYQKLVALTNRSLGFPNIHIKKLLNTHYRNGKNRTLCFRTWSDFVYVPGRLSRNLHYSLGYFLKTKFS